MNKIFVTGIGTGVGKSVVSAALVQALRANYWKPIQSGTIEGSDTETVASLVSNASSIFFTERYKLRDPLSPHAAAQNEGITIELCDFTLPDSSAPLVIEGAGGLLVPINNRHCIIDLAQHLRAPVLLVSNNYLGSINHTLLSIAELRRREIPIVGLLFCGDPNIASESVISEMSSINILPRLPTLNPLNSESLANYAYQLRTAL